MVAIRRKMTLAKSELVFFVSKYCLGNRSAKLTGSVPPFLPCSCRELSSIRTASPAETGLDLLGRSPAKLSSFNWSPDLVSFNAGLQAVGRK
jgi:hypothetical protein